MKYFSALKHAEFATSAFSAVGLDLEALAKAGDVSALKTLIDSKAKAAGESKDYETLLADATKENGELEARILKIGADLTAAQSQASLQSAVAASLASCGIDLKAMVDDKGAFSAEKFAAAHKATVAKGAREMICKAGHPGLAEEITKDPASVKKTETKRDDLTGSDRIRADFNRQFRSQKN